MVCGTIPGVPSLRQLDVFGEGPQLSARSLLALKPALGIRQRGAAVPARDRSSAKHGKGPWGKPSQRMDKAQPTALVALEKITLGTAVSLFASVFHLQGTV